MKRQHQLNPTLFLWTVAACALWLAVPAWAAGPGELGFDESSFEVLEEAGVAVITVERSGGEDGVVTVDYHTTTGTAAEGIDYGAVSGTLTWANADGGDRTFTVPIFDDVDPEGEENVLLVLSNATGGATLDGAASIAELVILASDGGGGTGDDDDDDDDTDGDSDDDDTDSDSDDDDTDGDSDDDDTDGDSDSDDDDTDGDSDDDDTDGDSDDDDTDGDSDDDDTDGDSDDDSDNDGGNNGTLKFDEESFEVLEDAGVAIITVERSHGDDGEVSVDYVTSDGSAVDGEDYTGVSGTLTWFAGDGTDRTFVVPILDDADPEGDETIELTLHTPTGGAVVDDLRGTSVVIVLANDGPGGGDDGGGDDDGASGTLKLSSGTFQVTEGAVMAIIAVERSHGEAGAVSVDYMTADGTATDGEDYTGVTGTLTWADGDGANKTLLIPMAGDDAEEGNETLKILLSNPVGGAELDLQRDSAVLTIVDDDSASCAAGDDTLCLLGGRFQVQVVWQTEIAAGPGRPVALSDKSGMVWFFDPANVELLVKVLDGCRFSGSYWVFFAATTDLELDVTVTDTVTGQSMTYHNPLGQSAQPVQDMTTFSCN